MSKIFILKSAPPVSQSETMLKIGDVAPVFTISTDNGDRFSLDDSNGKRNVVLYFYPKDFTTGCTKQACGFEEYYGTITEQNAVIIGISSDSIKQHRRFKSVYDISYTLGSDLDGHVTRMYEAERMFNLGGAKRVTYVIDKTGIIRAAFRHEFAINRHRSQVIRALQAINRDT